MPKSSEYYKSKEFEYFANVNLKKTDVTTNLSRTMIAISSAILVFTATFIKDRVLSVSMHGK